IPADGEYQFTTRGRGVTYFDVSIDGQTLPRQPVHLSAGAHHLSAAARMRRGSDSMVALEWKTQHGFEPVPFYRIGTEAAARPAVDERPADQPAASDIVPEKIAPPQLP